MNYHYIFEMMQAENYFSMLKIIAYEYTRSIKQLHILSDKSLKNKKCLRQSHESLLEIKLFIIAKKT